MVIGCLHATHRKDKYIVASAAPKMRRTSKTKQARQIPRKHPRSFFEAIVAKLEARKWHYNSSKS
ncbi:uncharacterized protein G2W53_011485 [Senna tora]|uniref:Uncharacterized protein n=1 Tax=Senna tora TaxID=362788 RepID=A0A835CCG5_9FABA|nr:uncharacterized protein G2W53_011485 [Senna tora]